VIDEEYRGYLNQPPDIDPERAFPEIPCPARVFHTTFFFDSKWRILIIAYPCSPGLHKVDLGW
jgi:hypothetical protein